MTLLESLIGILIFSVGVLAIIGIQALAIGHAGESRYRSEAAALAADVISQMWATADRKSEAAITASVCAFTLHTSPCAATPELVAMKSTKEHVDLKKRIDTALGEWQVRVAQLPGGAATIQVNPLGPGGEADFNQVMVTISWRAPNGTDHSYATMASVH